MRSRVRTAAAAAVLMSMALAVYLPVLRHGFLNFDDNLYVTDNRNLAAGFGWRGVVWAFTSVGYCGNWHPLTWLSHLLDVELFGLDPGGHHLTGLVLHLANGVLLFLVLRALTGAFWRSAAVAALFAVHPLHVESVAWVSERKDVLSTLFWILATGAYLRYARRPGPAAYLAVVLLFALGLMAKPMVVTLPLVLLLLDLWPLGRLRFPRGAPGREAGGGAAAAWGRLIVEKLPLFALSAASGVLTLAAQRQGGAVGALDAHHLAARLPRVPVSYVRYVGQMFWPDGLAVFYPFSAVSAPRAILASVLLVLVCVAAVRAGRTRGYPVTGWFWYLFTLLPVIGLVQAGAQSGADRYTYVPLTGLFVVLAWGTEEASRTPRRRGLAVGLSLVALSLLMVAARAQVNRWRDTATLFRHALLVTDGNWLAHNVLGKELHAEGRLAEAVQEFRAAVALMPGFAPAHDNLGQALFDAGLFAKAAAVHRTALRIEPDNPRFHTNLGNVLDEMGSPAEAMKHYRAALRVDPGAPEIHFNIGVLLEGSGDDAGAERHYRETLALDPRFGEAQRRLGRLLDARRRAAEAEAGRSGSAGAAAGVR